MQQPLSPAPPFSPGPPSPPVPSPQPPPPRPRSAGCGWLGVGMIVGGLVALGVMWLGQKQCRQLPAAPAEVVVRSASSSEETLTETLRRHRLPPRYPSLRARLTRPRASRSGRRTPRASRNWPAGARGGRPSHLLARRLAAGGGFFDRRVSLRRRRPARGALLADRFTCAQRRLLARRPSPGLGVRGQHHPAVGRRQRGAAADARGAYR
jgi:hypothetical protein